MLHIPNEYPEWEEGEATLKGTQLYQPYHRERASTPPLLTMLGGRHNIHELCITTRKIQGLHNVEAASLTSRNSGAGTAVVGWVEQQNLQGLLSTSHWWYSTGYEQRHRH